MDRMPGTGPELWEPDASGRPQPLTERTRTTHGLGRLGLSVPGAVVGSFLIATLAFGAAGGANLASSALGGGADGPTTGDAGGAGTDGDGEALYHLGEPGGTASPTDAPEVEQPGGSEPTSEPTDEPDGEPTAEPTEKPEGSSEPEPKPTAPTPEVATLELAAIGGEGRIVLEWSACATDAFRFYKVVRSTDETVTFPKGENDSHVAAIEDRGTTRVVDEGAAAGKTTWYRVFAYATLDGHTVLVCRSRLAKAVLEAPEPTPKPTEKPDPTEKPEAGSLGLTLALREGGVKVDWTACEADAFAYYKVLRSTDSTVTWPHGDNDSKVAGIEDRSKTAIWDGGAPAGKKVWYRVFCLDGEGHVLAATAAKSIVTPEKESTPKPETSSMGFDLAVTEDGVVLEWEACGGELFRYYKVVRSAGSNPSYLPWTEGSEVIAVIEAAGTTRFVDTHADPGQTWHYRIQAIGVWEGEKVLLGTTAAKSVTLE